MREFKLVVLGILGILGVLGSPLSAQSNVTYELKVGTTGENALLAEFPESYAGEKININVQCTMYNEQTADSFDFIFSSMNQPNLADRFDSIYSYTDEAEVAWTVWQSKKEIKNRNRRVMAQNAYKTFDGYVRMHTAEAQRSRGWIWWLFAGLLLVGTALYGGWIFYERRKEKNHAYQA